MREETRNMIYHNDILNSKSSWSILMVLLADLKEQNGTSIQQFREHAPKNNSHGHHRASAEHKRSITGKSFIKMNYLRLPWNAFLDGECMSGLESELMTIFPIPASMASLSSMSLLFSSEVAVLATGL